LNVSKYEKFVVRDPVRGDPNLYKPGFPTTRFLNGPYGAIKEAHTVLSIAWIDKDCANGVSKDKGPHEHNFDEIFLFLGNNREDCHDLGAEIEFWMGQGEDTEIIKINTSSVIYVPKGTVHMPIFFKHVKRPILQVINGCSIGEEIKVLTYPTRGV
jgi:hypothetical protein